MAVGTTLAVAGLLQPAFQACRDLYKIYKRTQSFGEDFEIAKRNFAIQVCRLEAVANRKLGFLKTHLDPFDENNPATTAVINQLVVLQLHFKECRRLMEKYDNLRMCTVFKSKKKNETNK